MKRANTLRIALAQIASEIGEVEKNLDRMHDFTERAVAQNAELVVFPELAVSGYCVNKAFSDAAITPGSERAKKVKALSSKIDVVTGFIEETEDHKFFNSAMYLHRGRVRHVHRKIYLPTYRLFDERRYYGGGWSVRAFDTPWARMAILVCGDAWHISLPYLAIHDGADILIFPAASPREGLSPSVSPREAWTAMNRSYGLTLSTFVLFCNQANNGCDLDFWGGSHVILPDGNVQEEAKIGEEDLVVCDLNLDALREQRLALPFRRDDSLPFTLQQGREIVRSMSQRHDGFLSEAITGDSGETPPPSAPESPPLSIGHSMSDVPRS